MLYVMKNLTLCLATSTWMFLAAFLPESQMLAQTRFIGAAMLDQNPTELVYRVQYGAYSNAVLDAETPYPLDDKETLSGPNGLTIHVGPKHSHIEGAQAELSRALDNQHEDAFLTAYLNGAKVSMDALSQKEITRESPIHSKHQVDVESNEKSLLYQVQIGRYAMDLPVEVLNAMLTLNGVRQTTADNGDHIYVMELISDEQTARLDLQIARNSGFDDAFLVITEQDALSPSEGDGALVAMK